MTAQLLRVRELPPTVVQQRFERALRRRVGRGTEIERSRLAEEIGCDARTVDGWMNEGRTPPMYLLVRLVAFFGPTFWNEIFGIPEMGDASQRALSIADIIAQEKIFRDAADRLRDVLYPQAKVIELKGRRA